MNTIDLNCDLGESFGNYNIGCDKEILKYVSSVNIACGFHAGDPVVMQNTVKMALEQGVGIGAHPGYPDLMGFGRRTMKLSYNEIKAYMIYQIGALKTFVEVNGGNLQHVKPHGALYNEGASNYEVAIALAEAVKEIDRKLIFVGLANSNLIKAAEEIGLKTASEGFADRNYNSNGTLVSRRLPNAVIEDNQTCINRVIRMIKEKSVKAIDDKTIRLNIDTICLHGDNEKAVVFAKNIKSELLKNNINLQRLNL